MVTDNIVIFLLGIALLFLGGSWIKQGVDDLRVHYRRKAGLSDF